MWIKEETFQALKNSHAELLELCVNAEKHIELAHMEIFRLRQENHRLKSVRPQLKVVKNDRA